MITKTAHNLINYNSYKGVGRPTMEDYRSTNQLIFVVFSSGILIGLFEYLVWAIK